MSGGKKNRILDGLTSLRDFTIGRFTDTSEKLESEMVQPQDGVESDTQDLQFENSHRFTLTRTVEGHDLENQGQRMLFLAELCTHLWRLNNKIIGDKDSPPPEMRKAYRHLTAMLDLTKQAGIEIVDLKGKPFDSGMPLKVISFQPIQGIGREQIIETIKPLIIYKDQFMIQRGEVVVGVPSESDEGVDAKTVEIQISPSMEDDKQ